MVLENGDCLTALANGCVLALARVAEVDEEGPSFGAGGHEVYAAFEHEDEVLDLFLGAFRVLEVWVQVEAWSAAVVVA